MSWADILVALDALFILPALSAAVVLAGNAVTSADRFCRSDWSKKGLSALSRIAFKDVEASASRH